VRDQPDGVEAAHGGTLFLDEIGESAHLAGQAVALSCRTRSSSEWARAAPARWTCAWLRHQRDLETDVQQGVFREDLLYRLNVIEIVVPALRDRAEDILVSRPSLPEFYARAVGRPIPTLSHPPSRLWCNTDGRKTCASCATQSNGPLSCGPRRSSSRKRFRQAASVDQPGGPQLGGDVTLAEIEAEHIRRVVARAASQDAARRYAGHRCLDSVAQTQAATKSAPADLAAGADDRAILSHALESRKPVLAICYGCQL